MWPGRGGQGDTATMGTWHDPPTVDEVFWLEIFRCSHMVTWKHPPFLVSRCNDAISSSKSVDFHWQICALAGGYIVDGKGVIFWWKKKIVTKHWALSQNVGPKIFLFLLDMLTVEFTKIGDVVGFLLKKVTKRPSPSSRDSLKHRRSHQDLVATRTIVFHT